MAFLLWQLFGNRTTTRPTPAPTGGAVTLTFWGLYDDASIFAPIINAYQAANPNVKINYVQKEASIYEFVSLNLLASQEGPDLWLIPSEWLPKHRDKLSAAPIGLLAKQNGLQSARRRLFARPSPPPSNAQIYQRTFAPVTAEENVIGEQVYTLPLAVDTLGLYANSQLLEAAGVKSFPATWEEMVAAAKKLAKREGIRLTRPAINLGANQNVSRASDILALLMIQNHTPLSSEDRQAALLNQTLTKETGEPVKPGASALDFYTSFASPTKENYSWSAELNNDYQLFSQGQLPFYIDYSYRLRDLRQQASALPLATGRLPQVSLTDQPKTLGSGLMVGVPSVSKKSAQAWDFISFLTNRENSLTYARAAGRPPARLELMTAPGYDPALAPFISQLPYAVGWFRNNIIATDKVFRLAIDAVLGGRPIDEVIDTLAKQFTHILRNEPYE